MDIVIIRKSKKLNTFKQYNINNKLLKNVI